MATGYTKDVDFTSSFIFETWLLEAIHTYKRYAVNELMILQRKKRRTLQKYLVLNHSDFIWNRKNKEPTKLAFYLMLYRTSIVILGKILIAKFYIILDLKRSHRSLFRPIQPILSRPSIEENYKLLKERTDYGLKCTRPIPHSKKRKESVLPYTQPPRKPCRRKEPWTSKYKSFCKKNKRLDNTH